MSANDDSSWEAPSESAMDARCMSVNQPGFLRFRWPLLMAAASFLVRPLDRLAVDLLNPDQVRPTLDDLAFLTETWAPRLQLLLIFSSLLVTGLLAGRPRARMASICGALAFFVAEAVVGVLKRVVSRPRPVHPEAAYEFIRPLYDRPDLRSFPSGHAATAVLFAIFVCLITRSRFWRGLAWAGVVVVMADRLYLGAHRLSEVFFGGAVGWTSVLLVQRLAGLYRVPITGSRCVRRWAGFAVLAWIIVATWLLNAPLQLVDALTGTELDTFHRPVVAYPVTGLEPLFGPALKLASLPDLKSFAFRALIWVALGTGLAIMVMRRRALPWLAGLFLFMAVWGGMALAGLPGRQSAPRPHSGAPVLAVDLQSHIGDPLDGGISLEDGLRRFRRLGFDVVVPTWHNSWSQGRRLGKDGEEPIELWGSEWSQGPPGATPLHLLVFNRRPSPEDLTAVTDWRELIEVVHREGGVVLASHFWRGDATNMPRARELVAAGIDGFEVAGRNQELRAEALSRLDEIRSICRQEGLVATASSDFHGARSGNYSWNLVAADPARGDLVVWDALTRQGDPFLPVVIESPLARDPGIFLPPAVAWSYFRELSIKARLSWFLWLGVILAGLRFWAGWRGRQR